ASTGRRTPVVVTVALLVAVAAGGAAGIAVAVARSTAGAHRDGSAVSREARLGISSRARCASPALPSSGRVPRTIGSWPFRLEVPGTFGSLVAGPRGSVSALQACGRQEGSLRVVRVGRDGRLLAVSQQFPRAALLTSSLAAAWHVLLLGAARLDLASTSLGQLRAPPACS
ncbi:MAG: hypothetical protein ACRD0B_06150, partial [Acidimicrobiales bacterium]